MRIALAISVMTVCAFAQTTWFPPAITAGHAAGIGSLVTPGSFLTIHVIAPGSVPTTGQALIDVTKIQVTLTSAASDKVYTPALIPRPTPLETWLVVPQDMPLGAATATLTASNAVVGTAAFTVVSSAPGLFTYNVTGYTWNITSGSGSYSSTSSGPALAQNNPVLDGRPNELTNPAVPGQFVTLWATGLGSTSGWTLDLAGTIIVPSFVGATAFGTNQINFKVPANPPVGCYVPVTLKHGDIASNAVTLAINTTPGACPHPLGLTYGDLVTLDSGKSIQMGQVSISAGSTPVAPPTVGGSLFPSKPAANVMVTFGATNGVSMFALAGPQAPNDQLFGCQVTPSLGGNGAGGIGTNVGDALTLSGPGGKVLSIPGLTGSGLYHLQLADAMLPFFEAGTWTLGANGNATIGAFQRSFTLPPPVSGLNRDELASLRSGDDVTVRWNNSGYGVDSFATITVVSNGVITTCRTYAFMGIFTIPSAVVDPAGGTLTLTIQPAPYARQQFTIPLVGAAGSAGSTAQTVVNFSLSDYAALAFH